MSKRTKPVRWTRQLEQSVLDTIGATGSVAEASRRAGLGRDQIMHRVRKVARFHHAYQEAKNHAHAHLLAVARDRAVAGTEQLLLHGGQPVRDADGAPVRLRAYSDRLMLFLLQRIEDQLFIGLGRRW